MNINTGKHVYSALSAIVVRPAANANDTAETLKVFPVIADFNTPTPPTPFAVYQRTSCQVQYTKGLWTGDITHNYSVTVADNQYSKTVELAQAAVDALMALSHTVKEDMRFGQVLLSDISEDFVDGIFLQTLNFEINTTQIL